MIWTRRRLDPERGEATAPTGRGQRRQRGRELRAEACGTGRPLLRIDPGRSRSTIGGTENVRSQHETRHDSSSAGTAWPANRVPRGTAAAGMTNSSAPTATTRCSAARATTSSTATFGVADVGILGSGDDVFRWDGATARTHRRRRRHRHDALQRRPIGARTWTSPPTAIGCASPQRRATSRWTPTTSSRPVQRAGRRRHRHGARPARTDVRRVDLNLALIDGAGRRRQRG